MFVIGPTISLAGMAAEAGLFQSRDVFSDPSMNLGALQISGFRQLVDALLSLLVGFAAKPLAAGASVNCYRFF